MDCVHNPSHFVFTQRFGSHGIKLSGNVLVGLQPRAEAIQMPHRFRNPVAEPFVVFIRISHGSDPLSDTELSSC